MEISNFELGWATTEEIRFETSVNFEDILPNSKAITAIEDQAKWAIALAS